MLNTLIVSPHCILFEGVATAISVPGINGEFMIYPKHCPLLSVLTEGTVAITTDQFHTEFIYLERGTIAIRNDHVKICADIAFKAREVQEAKVLEQKKQIQYQLDQQVSAINTQELLSQLARLNAQLLAVEKLRRSKKRI